VARFFTDGRSARDTLLAAENTSGRASRTVLENTVLSVENGTRAATRALRDDASSVGVLPSTALRNRLNNASLSVPLSTGRAAGLLSGTNSTAALVIVSARRTVILMVNRLEAGVSVEVKVLLTAGRLSTSLIRDDVGSARAGCSAFGDANSPFEVESRKARRLVFTDLAVEEAWLTGRGLLRDTSSAIEAGSRRTSRL
jgi:hypothetical protein